MTSPRLKRRGIKHNMRLQWLMMGVVLSVSGLGMCQDAMFRGSTEHRGTYEAAGVPKFSKMKWSFHTSGMVIGSPTVTGGVVYVGSDDGNFYAILVGSSHTTRRGL